MLFVVVPAIKCTEYKTGAHLSVTWRFSFKILYIVIKSKSSIVRSKTPFNSRFTFEPWSILLESLLGEVGQDEAGLVDLGVVVLALLLLLGGGPAADGDLKVTVGILGADHEADLAGGVGGNGGVGVLDGREDGLAVLLELGDERKVKPLVLSYNTQNNG